MRYITMVVVLNFIRKKGEIKMRIGSIDNTTSNYKKQSFEALKFSPNLFDNEKVGEIVSTGMKKALLPDKNGKLPEIEKLAQKCGIWVFNFDKKTGTIPLMVARGENIQVEKFDLKDFRTPFSICESITRKIGRMYREAASSSSIPEEFEGKGLDLKNRIHKLYEKINPSVNSKTQKAFQIMSQDDLPTKLHINDDSVKDLLGKEIAEELVNVPMMNLTLDKLLDRIINLTDEDVTLGFLKKLVNQKSKASINNIYNTIKDLAGEQIVNGIATNPEVLNIAQKSDIFITNSKSGEGLYILIPNAKDGKSYFEPEFKIEKGGSARIIIDVVTNQIKKIYDGNGFIL